MHLTKIFSSQLPLLRCCVGLDITKKTTIISRSKRSENCFIFCLLVVVHFFLLSALCFLKKWTQMHKGMRCTQMKKKNIRTTQKKRRSPSEIPINLLLPYFLFTESISTHYLRWCCRCCWGHFYFLKRELEWVRAK